MHIDGVYAKSRINWDSLELLSFVVVSTPFLTSMMKMIVSILLLQENTEDEGSDMEKAVTSVVWLSAAGVGVGTEDRRKIKREAVIHDGAGTELIERFEIINSSDCVKDQAK